MRINKNSILIITFIINSCNYSSENVPPSTNIKMDFYENGSIKSIKKSNDTTHLNQIISFDADGNISSIQKSFDTIPEGQTVWFYPNGNIENTVIFKDGQANGNSFIFYENGAIKNHRFWKKGVMAGYSTDFYNDSFGLIKDVFFYNDSGKLVGVKKTEYPGAPAQLIKIDSSK